MFEGLLQRFKDLHTQTKLMVGFGAVSIIILAMTAVGVVTLQQLRDQFRVMNDGSTVALANLGVFGNSFVDYHRLILQLPEEIRKKEDLERALNRLSKVKMEVYQPLAAYETSQLRVSRSGRDEANDLALLKKSLEEYFKEAEGAGSALMDSFTEATLTAEQAHQMRALGVLAIVNNLTPRYENVVT
jgi:hypothetical protein